METVSFGRTGLKVSKLCFGTMTIGSSEWKPWALNKTDSLPILKRALDLGITFFDMADWYSNGEGERVVGPALTSMVPRDRLVLTTKVFYAMSDDQMTRPFRKHLLSSPSTRAWREWALTMSTFSWRMLLTRYADRRDDGGSPRQRTIRQGRYLGASTMYRLAVRQMNAVAQ